MITAVVALTLPVNVTIMISVMVAVTITITGKVTVVTVVSMMKASGNENDASYHHTVMIPKRFRRRLLTFCCFFLHFRLYQTLRPSCPKSQLHWAWMSNLREKLRLCNVLPSCQNRGQWWKSPARSCTTNLWKESLSDMKESPKTSFLHFRNSLTTQCSIVSQACMHTEQMRTTWRCSVSIFIIIDGFGACKMKERQP